MKIISKSINKINKNRNKVAESLIISFNKDFSERRIVVTGMGTVNPLGVNTNESWENLKKFTSGIKNLENESFGKDLPNNCKIGAPIPKHFEAKKYKSLVINYLHLILI